MALTPEEADSHGLKLYSELVETLRRDSHSGHVAQLPANTALNLLYLADVRLPDEQASALKAALRAHLSWRRANPAEPENGNEYLLHAYAALALASASDVLSAEQDDQPEVDHNFYDNAPSRHHGWELDM